MISEERELQRSSPALGESHAKFYRPDIDGLRAIAILSVVLFHAGVPGFSGGFVGVDVFFVISGYLIGAHVYADVRRGHFKVSEFYRKRAKRILPALLVVLAFCYVAALLLLSPAEILNFARYCLATIASASNILAWLKADYFAAGNDQNPLLMTWSLGVEEQFYLLFPISMLLIARLGRRGIVTSVAAVTILSFAACVLLTPRFPTAAFYLLPTRAWELAVGILLAVYEDGRDVNILYNRQRWANVVAIAGLALIVFSIIRFDSRTPFPGSAATLPVVGSALLLTAPASWVSRLLLRSAPFIFVGQISYSFYLWHWPLLSFAHIISDGQFSAWMGCGIVAVALVFAWLSYEFVEQPCRRTRMSANPLLLRYALLCLVASLPAFALRKTSGLPRRFPTLGTVDGAAISISHRCGGAAEPDLSIGCVDRNDPRPAVALIGDSHAAALYPALDRLASQSGFKLYEMIKYQCPPLLGVTPNVDTIGHARECLDYNAHAIQIIESDPSVRVVAITSYWAGPLIGGVGYSTGNHLDKVSTEAESLTNLSEGLKATIVSLRSSGRAVIVLQDVPAFRFDPVRRIESGLIPVRGFLARHLFWKSASRTEAPLAETFNDIQRRCGEIVQQAAASEGVPTFDPARNLCSDDKCKFVDGVVPLYGDNHHVTSAGAAVALAGLQIQ